MRLVIATTQHFLQTTKYAKIEPAFLPKDKNTHFVVCHIKMLCGKFSIALLN
jgi:uncharacterized membrane protein